MLILFCAWKDVKPQEFSMNYVHMKYRCRIYPSVHWQVVPEDVQRKPKLKIDAREIE